MLIRALLLACASFSLPAQAQPTPLRLLPEQSEIVFTTKQMGVPVEGRFTRFSAQIQLDPKKPETGSVAFTIDTGSARFGSAELDTEVGKPGWLNVAKFPLAGFQSSAVKSTGAGRFEVAGRLTLKGVAQDLVVPVQWAQQGSTGIAGGSFTIKRLAFKVGEGEWGDGSLLADEVQVRFRLVLGGLGPP